MIIKDIENSTIYTVQELFYSYFHFEYELF